MGLAGCFPRAFAFTLLPGSPVCSCLGPAQGAQRGQGPGVHQDTEGSHGTVTAVGVGRVSGPIEPHDLSLVALCLPLSFLVGEE